MKYASLVIALFLIQAPPLVGQATTYFVDASGQVTVPPGAIWHRTITAASAVAVAGDTILIQGLVDVTSGQALGYSEQAWFAGSGEFFPIAIRPGVTVKAADAVRVYVWSTNSAAALFALLPSSNSQLTRLEDLTLVGGLKGVSVAHNGSTTTQVLLKNLAFAWNTICVSAIATGSHIQVSVRDAKIADQLVTTPMIAPSYLPPAIGLQFHAFDGQGPGNMKAEVIELGTYGTFASMSSDHLFGTHDLGVSAASRLVDVRAQGKLREHETLPASDISDVELIVQGGVWDGACETGGWDLGLYALAENGAAVPEPVDYTAGFRATLTGTEVKHFRLAGLAAVSNIYARGRLELNGQTHVLQTGSHTVHSPGDYLHSGVHLFARESYLAFIGINALLRNNTGNGLWANCPDEQYVPHYPQGIFIGMYRCGVHENDGNGVSMSVGSGTWTGVVGGTSHILEDGENYRRHLYDQGENYQSNIGVNTTAPLEFGQGAIIRSAISNNGESGVWARSIGTFDPVRLYNPDSVINFRLSNSFVWNNPPVGSGAGEGGLSVELVPAPDETDRGLCLLPVTHCTFVNNGRSSGWNAEIEDGSTSIIKRGRYEWSVLHDPILRTRFYNTIFYRDIPQFLLFDFGPNLEEIGLFEPSSSAVDVQTVGMAGLRARVNILNFSADQKYTSIQTPLPFVNSNPNFSLLLPDMFFLNPASGSIGLFRDWTTNYLTYPAPECTEDYHGQGRPPANSGLRDKGGDEL